MNLKKEEIDRLGNKTRENIVGISYITVSELHIKTNSQLLLPYCVLTQKK